MAGRNDVVSEDEMGRRMSITCDAVDSVRVTAPRGSQFGRLAESFLEMMRCYRSDAEYFKGCGDYVTGYAAICYAHAWIDCGCALGLLECPVERPGRSLTGGEHAEGRTDVVDDAKMAKYLDITARAMAKMEVSAPEKSFNRRLADMFMGTAKELYGEAERLAAEGDYIESYATVNRAHAWLDCAARIGLFDVGGDDVLFTLFE